MKNGEKEKAWWLIIVTFVTGIIYGGIKAVHIMSDEMRKIQKRQELFEGLYRPINEWFAKEQAGHGLRQFLEDKQYKRIGIYGMGNLANRMYDALKDSPVEVVCSIDENNSFYSDTDLITIKDEFPELDAIILTDYRKGEMILDELKKKGGFDILFLEDLIYNEL